MAIHVDSQQSSSPAGWLSNWIASPPFINQIPIYIYEKKGKSSWKKHLPMCAPHPMPRPAC